jgi:tRNA nucleotidyltransferase/poly(A) polymerase
MGVPPVDFDVATNATHTETTTVFRFPANSKVKGMKF